MTTQTTKPVFFQGGNWSRTDWRGNEQIFRVLGQDGDQIYVVEIGCNENGEFKLHAAPKTKCRRKVWSKRKANVAFREGNLFHIDERGIPAGMSATEIPAPGEDLKFDKRKAVVDYIVNKWGDAPFMDKDAYRLAIKNAATYFNTDEQSVRRWYETYLFYGRSDKALLTQDWAKGAPGVFRRGLRDENGKLVLQGRRPAKQLESPKGPDLRKMVSLSLHRDLCNFMKIQAWGGERQFTAAFKRFLQTLYGFNKDEKTGETRAYPIRPEKLPRKDNLQRIAREVFHRERTERATMQKMKSRRRQRFNSNSTRDLVHDQIPIYDLDATSVDNRVLFPHLPSWVEGHGRPTVLLAIDRGSGAIVGWYVTFEPENADGYVNCMFSAYTSKEEELDFYKLGYLKGFVYGCTAKIFVDRGAGVSKKMLEAIVERLKACMLIAAPYRPQAKGQVESEIGQVQRELSDLPGSTYPTGDKENDKKRRKESKTKAVSHYTFMQMLLVAISKRNIEVNKKHVLTVDMLKRKVIPCAADIYWYDRARLRGDAAWEWPYERTVRTFGKKHSLKAPDGVVTIDGRGYTSPGLYAEAFREEDRYKRTAVVTVYELPTSHRYALWEQPNGNLGVLEATVQTQRTFGDGLEMTPKQVIKARNSLAYDGLKQARDNDVAIARNLPGQLSKAKKKKVDDVDAHATFLPALLLKEEMQKATEFVEDTNMDRVLKALGANAPLPKAELSLSQLFPMKPKKHKLMVDF